MPCGCLLKDKSNSTASTILVARIYTKGDMAGFVPACTEDAALVPGRKML